MSPRRIVVLALATQGFLIVVAWLATGVLGLTTAWGDPVRHSIVGILVAFAFAVINYTLLVRAPRNWLVDGVRAVYDEVLVPLFSRLRPLSIVALGIAAGVGEEWLFRGVLLPMMGLAASSILFGFAHVGGRRMVPFGVWASGMGLALGLVASVTGGLIAPIVAHAVYDMLALEFIRRGAQTT